MTSGDMNANNTSHLPARTLGSSSGGNGRVRMAWAKASEVCELRWIQTQSHVHKPQRAVEIQGRIHEHSLEGSVTYDRISQASLTNKERQ